MKKIVALGFVALISAGAFAHTPPPITEKVLQAFRETFSEAENVTWYETNDQTSVRFTRLGVKFIVYYNKNGKITGSMRFYDPSLLPVNVLSGVRKKYTGKKFFGVTEISSGDRTVYFIKMEDDNYWYTIKADVYGNGEEYEVLKKQK